MFRISHEIRIAAPADRVWAVTADIERWPDWLPTVTAVRRLTKRPFGPGSRFELKQPFQRAAIWELTGITPGRSYTWRRSPGRMLRLLARHQLLNNGANTFCRLSLVCSGPLAIWLRPILVPLLRAALARENAALKTRCEARTSPPHARPVRPHVPLKRGVDAT
ncbi:MAG TPA: SRPBCC family protein [Amaricoccus sp.]|uniref:SRPBCC family protein n=1 Tax=Amaricoccus sp. TaxID=1872485 RepID=UPI002BFD989C|nr:SRPBCC family protein [Amaricoccus sp.]HMQ94869.1 SRPBCC family protein [Amaricoccus sp.]HMR54674.1 SRPBCC family protein [Amaricoccus sp.]HMU01704.1 SRPBCC family protein [Amaricoccus sp.]